MPSFRGYPACSCLARWLPAYEAELKRRGVIKYNLDVYQLIGGAKASGGTHSTGGAFDIAQTSDLAIKVARQMGADATWFRPRNWDNKGGMAHTHGVLRGCTHNGPARYQIAAVDAGYNGLGSGGRGGRDTGPRPLSKRTWQQGIAWAKAEAAPKKIRFVTWNVALNFTRPGLADRTNRIAAKLKGWSVDFAALQEAPSSKDGKVLFPKLAKIGLDKRVGSHGRYIIFRSSVTTVHDWTSLNFGDKRATVVFATIRGRKKVIANCHSRSGSDAATVAHRARWAEKVIAGTFAFAKRHGVSREDVIFLGDFNGSEFAKVAEGHSFGRGRSYSAIKTALIRTYNAWGKKHKDAGGQFDYALFHLAFLKAKQVLKAKTFFTPRAADHNPVFFEIKE